VFDAAGNALNAGYHIAGFLSYDSDPLVALGVYDAPRSIDLDPEPRGFSMGPPAPRVSRAQYDAAIENIQTAIRDGDVYQVNYTLPFDFNFTGDPFNAYSLLAKTSQAEYCAFVDDGNRAILSLSPELFLRFEGERLTTKPMKGTAPLHATRELTNEKNRAEHVMIVDLLRNDFHRICTEVTVSDLFRVERYPTFATMTSTVSGKLDPRVSFAEIMRATFPCGSVTGAPKMSAMKHIAQFETHPRQVYTGSIGYLTPQRTGWWNVAIRTLQIDRARERGRLDAGGGIVSDSVAEDEWRETLLKTAFVRPAVEPFACLETLRCGPEPSDAEAHLMRLRATAERFCIDFDDSSVRERIVSLNACTKAALARISLSLDGTATLETQPLEENPEHVSVCLSGQRVSSDDPMLAYKTSWRPAHDAAAEFARRLGCFDALLRNERDELTEGSRTNLFARIGGTLYTPPLRCGVLPGILRSRLISTGEAVERVLYDNDLQSAEGIFVGNSARGLLRAQLTSERNRV